MFGIDNLDVVIDFDVAGRDRAGALFFKIALLGGHAGLDLQFREHRGSP
jgi:hypothetical protein